MTRPGGVWTNWGRSARVRPRRVEFPASTGAVQRAVRAARARGMRVKAVGAGHSFSAIAVAPDVLLDLTDLTGLVGVDHARALVTLRAGTRLRDVPRLLAPYGLAMENLGDIDRQSISGAISTGTHGTGARFGGLATQVAGAVLVTADGELLEVGEDDPLLPAVALGLGALGILVEVTLRCVPAFVLQAVERAEPLDAVVADLPARVAAADHFEFYWFPGTATALTKTDTRLPEHSPRRPRSRLGRFLGDEVLANGVYEVACLVGTAIPPFVPVISSLGNRFMSNGTYSDASHRVFTQNRGVRFREMEYALPAEEVAAAFTRLRVLVAERRLRISFPVEVRFAAADDRWLSTAHRRASGYIAVHRYWREDPREYFDAAEEILREHGGRPHWGKMHTADAAVLRERYPRFDDFTALRDRLDPDRVFANPYLDRVLGE
ncbi:D-arabinono-1,4-lactone oxidase [Microbacterium sp. X-17]|uniref:D-arabinono-1,4-lactone oxidase n=1 Tax=Microbacterium sp. X-17 TaxID=3144404 RepID=UPI0031F4FA4B